MRSLIVQQMQTLALPTRSRAFCAAFSLPAREGSAQRLDATLALLVVHGA